MNYEQIYQALETAEEKIRFLKSLLSSQQSPFGDWKVVKIYEARLRALPDPYDFAALSAAREQIRGEINRLQEAPEPGEAEA